MPILQFSLFVQRVDIIAFSQPDNEPCLKGRWTIVDAVLGIAEHPPCQEFSIINDFKTTHTMKS